MKYELTALLLNANVNDFEFLVGCIEKSNGELSKLLTLFKNNPSDINKRALVLAVEKEIRYLGSSNVGYIFRSIFTSKSAGVSIEEMANDVADKMKVGLIKTSNDSAESKLVGLVEGAADERLFKLSIAEQEALFESLGFDTYTKNRLYRALVSFKRGEKLAIEQAVGKDNAKKLMLALTADFLSSYTAKHYPGKTVAKIAAALSCGVGLIASAAWTTFDLQGPSYKKTVPIMFYLGMLAVEQHHAYN